MARGASWIAECQGGVPGDKLKVGYDAYMVLKKGHCFHDLCLRYKPGEISGELICIISNQRRFSRCVQVL